jgi:hypothetical protein
MHLPAWLDQLLMKPGPRVERDASFTTLISVIHPFC